MLRCVEEPEIRAEAGQGWASGLIVQHTVESDCCTDLTHMLASAQTSTETLCADRHRDPLPQHSWKAFRSTTWHKVTVIFYCCICNPDKHYDPKYNWKIKQKTHKILKYEYEELIDSFVISKKIFLGHCLPWRHVPAALSASLSVSLWVTLSCWHRLCRPGWTLAGFTPLLQPLPSLSPFSSSSSVWAVSFPSSASLSPLYLFCLIVSLPSFLTTSLTSPLLALQQSFSVIILLSPCLLLTSSFPVFCSVLPLLSLPSCPHLSGHINIHI